MNEWDRFMTEWDKLTETLHLPEHKFTVEEVEEIIKDYDFVPVVRCKDCKYWRNFGNEYHSCDIFTLIEEFDSVSYESDPDDYCSRGERRDEDETN